MTERVTVSATVLKLTRKAALLGIGDKEQWVPLSVIDEGADLDETELDGEPQDLHIAKWFCDKEGIDA